MTNRKTRLRITRLADQGQERDLEQTTPAELNPDFRDMLSALSEEGVEFLLVGAFALAAHGLPRATGDIDIWVRRSEANAARIWRALNTFGAPRHDLTIDDLVAPHDDS